MGIKWENVIRSKTLWLNIIGIGAIAFQAKTGYALPPEYQAVALGAANVGVRFVTKKPLMED